VLPGYQRGGYVPAGFLGGSVTDGLVLLEVERQMWAPLGNARRSRQRILGAALILAVSLMPSALYNFGFPKGFLNNGIVVAIAWIRVGKAQGLSPRVLHSDT